jgi:IS30 family transposase
MQGNFLTSLERQKIQLFLKGHVPLRQIARSLHRNHGVISREIKRNKDIDGKYKADVAQVLADRRRGRTRKSKIDQDEALKRYVIDRLKEDWSPEQIAGRLKIHSPPELQGRSVSHETIYGWLYEGKGRWEQLHTHLRQGKKKRQRRYARKARGRTSIPERISIHQRPGEVNEKKEVGHWESDSVIFPKQKPRISVQYERKTMYAQIHRLSNGTAEETERVIAQSIESFPHAFWKTITFDNGGEGATHAALRTTYDLDTYFCDPYASWQKGGVENLNGLIRQYLPRSTDMNQLTDKDIYAIQEKLNQRPRKSLGYATPHETMWCACCGKAVVHC